MSSQTALYLLVTIAALQGCSGSTQSALHAAAPPTTGGIQGQEGTVHDGGLLLVNKVTELQAEKVSFGRGSAMVDFDNDGLLDLALANAGMDNAFFRQRSNRGFEPMNVAWGIAPDTRAHWGMVAADYDNDGDSDIYVVTGGFKKVEANQLLRNDINTSGVFTDVSGTSIDAAVIGRAFSGTALDYDNDGMLDIFSTESTDTVSATLLRNLGNMQFADVTTAANIDLKGRFLGSSSGDWNNDGWVDIATAHYHKEPVLHENRGNGKFNDIAPSMGLTHIVYNFGCLLEDFNNDGALDILVPKYDELFQGLQSRLYMNNGTGTGFQDLTAYADLKPCTAMGHNSGDINGDGYPDLMIGTGAPGYMATDFLYLFRKGDANGPDISNASTTSGLNSFGITRSHGFPIGDYDEDGDVDAYANHGGPQGFPTTAEPNAFWVNQGNDNNWTALRLEGVISNRSGIGAHLIATTNTGREVHRYLRAGHGFGNTNSPIQNFGIGEDDFISQIIIRWPSGLTQTLPMPAMSTLTDIVEAGVAVAGDPDDFGTFSIGIAGEPDSEVDLMIDGQTFATARLDARGAARVQLQRPLHFELEGDAGELSAWIYPTGKTGEGYATPSVRIAF
ncbi:MAG: CRTAC1 family protein [Planctomycetota bacterium]|nr:CRTAC1 family protein [Planctomycetota bacterium]